MKTCKIFTVLAALIGLPVLLKAQTPTTVVYKYAFFTQEIPVSSFAGKPFKLSANVKSTGNEQAAVTIFAQVKLKNGKSGYRSNPAQTMGNFKDWKPIILTGNIDSDATVLEFGGYTREIGAFFFDNFHLEVETASGKWQRVIVPNGDFENGPVQDWVSGTATAPLKFDGVSYETERNHPFAGKSSLKLLARYINYGNNPVNGNYALVNGIQLYYETYGEGKPLVLLHGNGGNIANQSVRISFFKSRYKVIAVDSRAQGRSGDDGKELTYDLMADDLDQLLGQLHIDSAFIWGQSDGGIIALELAMKYPQRVRKLAAWGANLQANASAFMPGIYQSIAAEAKSKDPVKRKLNTMMFKYPNIPFDALGAIKVPALIMAGDKDAIAPEHTLKIYQSIPKGQLFIMPGATHFGSYEKPALFNLVLQDFFNQP